MKRFFAAVFSAIIFALMYSAISYVPLTQQEPNVYYFGFYETFVFVVLYAGPVYILFGIPISVIIDKSFSYKKRSYMKKLVVYAIAGMLIGCTFIMLIFQVATSSSIVLFYASIGLAASLIYYHLLIFINYVNERKKNTSLAD